MIVHRQNSIGLRFQLSEFPNKQTRIQQSINRIIVNHPIEVILTGWYKWQVNRKFVQDAFPMLSSDEREFLVSGTTAEQWAKTFPFGIEEEEE